MTTEREDTIRHFYTGYHDQILDKRHNSPYWLRRYAHRQIHMQFLPYLKPGQRILDAGCGEGVLTYLIAGQGIEAIGVDISASNIAAAQHLAQESEKPITFLQADAERLPFPDNSFDVVISSHVLEHLPNIAQGLQELYRITRSLALIAMPTCLNPAGWVLLGGDQYWKLSRGSFWALPRGLYRTVLAFGRGEEGPNEGYGGCSDAPHVWRFPWVMRRHIERTGFRIGQFEAGPLILPYLGEYFPLLRRLQLALDRLRGWPLVRNFGYGSMAVCFKDEAR